MVRVEHGTLVALTFTDIPVNCQTELLFQRTVSLFFLRNVVILISVSSVLYKRVIVA